jgi:hypothetical protein
MEGLQLGYLDVSGRIIFKLIQKRVCGCGVNSSGLGYGPVAVTCRHGNELTVSVTGREYVDQLSNYRLLKKDSL